METYTETYKGMTITVMHDPGCDNPLRNVEDIEVTVYCPGYGASTHEDHYNGGVDLPTITAEDLRGDNWKAIFEAVNMPVRETLLRSLPADRLGTTNAVDLINALIDIELPYTASDKGEVTANLINAKQGGDVALFEHGHGYSQGDYHYILIRVPGSMIDPESEDQWDPVSCMKGVANEYRLWVYGDVYRYELTDVNGESVGGCGGFVCERDDDSWNYMMGEARDEIDTAVAGQMVPVCVECGSTNVAGFDPNVTWDVDRQAWVLSDDPSTVDCNECDNVDAPAMVLRESVS